MPRPFRSDRFIPVSMSNLHHSIGMWLAQGGGDIVQMQIQGGYHAEGLPFRIRCSRGWRQIEIYDMTGHVMASSSCNPPLLMPEVRLPKQCCMAGSWAHHSGATGAPRWSGESNTTWSTQYPASGVDARQSVGWTVDSRVWVGKDGGAASVQPRFWLLGTGSTLFVCDDGGDILDA